VTHVLNKDSVPWNHFISFLLVNIKHAVQNNAYVLCRYNTPVGSEEIRYPHTIMSPNIYRFSVFSKLG